MVSPLLLLIYSLKMSLMLQSKTFLLKCALPPPAQTNPAAAMQAKPLVNI